MNCDCIKVIDSKLKEKNLCLSGYAYAMPDFEPIITISTDWVDRDKAPRGQRRDPTKMFASHCPFCGTKIES